MEYDITFTQTQWTLVLSALVVAGFALLGGFVYAISTRGELTERYRGSAVASAALQGVAFVAYIVITLGWIVGYNHVGDRYVPSSGFRFDNGVRYLDWAITVPLLMIELTAVLRFVGPAKQRLRTLVVPSALLMIVAGWIGTDPASNHDKDHSTLLIWGGISTVFFLVVFGVIYPVMFSTIKDMAKAPATSLRNIGSLLVFTWGVYPIAYMFPVFFGTGDANAAVVRQLLFSATDIAAKVGYGVMVHKLAKMLSAESVNAGEETHEDPIFVSGEKIAEARPAVAVALAQLMRTPSAGGSNGIDLTAAGTTVAATGAS